MKKSNKIQKKDRLFFYAPGLYPCKTGGMEIFNYYLLNTLRKATNTFDLQVFTVCKELINKHTDTFLLHSKLLGIRRRGVGAISHLISLLVNPRFNPKKTRLMFVPFTSNFSYYGLIFVFFNKVFHVPYVVHIHSGGRMNALKPKWIHNCLFKNAWKIAAVSPKIAEDYSRRFKRKVNVLLPLLPLRNTNEPVEIIKKRNQLNHFKKIILFVGSLKSAKGPDVLLRAFLSANRRLLINNNVGLVFCGEGNLKSELENQAKHSDLSERIVFKGNVPNNVIHEYYAISDIFVLPSWYEGTSTSLIQAMQNSLLCVTTDVEGNNIMIQNESNGLLFPKDDVASLTNIIDGVFKGKYNVNNLKQSAKITYENKYDYNQYINHLMSYLLESDKVELKI